MIAAFEEPSKTELRAACIVAIDQAGYEAVNTLHRVPLPPPLNGSLMGDAQSLNAQQQRTFYYVRPVAGDSLPKWLANIARASHTLRAGDMYVVVREYPPAFEQACASAGAGLLLINDDNAFEVVLRYADVAPVDLAAERISKLDGLRRGMERKLELARKEIEARHHRVSQLVADMEPDDGDKYLKRIEAEYKAAEDWGSEISRRLDSVGVDTPTATIDEIEAVIGRGVTGVVDAAA